MERRHHVVAIAPRVSKWVVLVNACRIRVAGDIQPVPSPAFPVVGRVQKVVHDASECIRGSVVGEAPDIPAVGRQALQVELGPPQQRRLRRRGRRLEARLAQPCQDESIDIVPHPSGLADIGHRRVRDRLECPMAAFGCFFVHVCPGDLGRLVARPRSAHADPVDQRVNRFLRKFRTRRHLDRALVADGADEGAGFVPAHDGTADHRIRIAEIDARRLKLLAVALAAVLKQQRPDALLEVFVRRFGGQRPAEEQHAERSEGLRTR